MKSNGHDTFTYEFMVIRDINSGYSIVDMVNAIIFWSQLKSIATTDFRYIAMLMVCIN